MQIKKHILKVCLILAGLQLLESCQTSRRGETVVRVRRGESLSVIAERYGLRWQDLARYNRLRSPHRLRPGQRLRVPLRDVRRKISNSPVRTKRRGLLYNQQRLIWPAQGRITSGFGSRWGRRHNGIDIAAPRGTKILAAEDGQVESAGWMRGYGRTIRVRHRGFKTLYAHCSRLKVKKGQKVRKGQVIGYIGATGNARGNHLHFEYRTLADVPKNPRLYLPGRGRITQK